MYLQRGVVCFMTVNIRFRPRWI